MTLGKLNVKTISGVSPSELSGMLKVEYLFSDIHENYSGEP